MLDDMEPNVPGPLGSIPPYGSPPARALAVYGAPMPEFREPDRLLRFHNFVDPAILTDTDRTDVRVALDESDVATRTRPIRVFLEHLKHLPESLDHMLGQAQKFLLSAPMDEHGVAWHEGVTP